MAQFRVFFDQHALGAMHERGVARAEAEETVLRGRRRAAKQGRLMAEKVFPFNATWQGRYYDQKRVRVIFEEHRDQIKVITVISFYF